MTILENRCFVSSGKTGSSRRWKWSIIVQSLQRSGKKAIWWLTTFDRNKWFKTLARVRRSFRSFLRKWSNPTISQSQDPYPNSPLPEHKPVFWQNLQNLPVGSYFIRFSSRKKEHISVSYYCGSGEWSKYGMEVWSEIDLKAQSLMSVSFEKFEI